jgi:hypothetical protein
VSGISPTAPILIGAYGSGARPILQTNQGGGTAIAFSQGGGGNCGTGGDYIAFIGIEWFAYLRDPNCPSACTQPDNQQGISFLNTAHWVLIEDNYFHHYRQALVFESQVKWQVIIRRNILVDQFDQSGSFAEGTFLSLVMQAVVVENLFDNNGELGQGPTAFDHNIYIDGIDNTTGNYPGPSIIVGNIFTNDASGSQFRAGGYVYNNIFAQNQYPHNFGAPVKGSGNISFKNVYLEAKNPGWGPQTVAYYNGSGIDDHKYSNGSILIQNNIITQTAFPSGGFGVDVSPGQQNTTVANNIICNWGGSPLILDEATGGILQFGSMTPGSGYTPDGTYTGVALTTLTGVGSGAHATVTINGGALVNITITQNDNTHAGNGKAYAIGDTVGIGSCCGAGSGAIAPIAKVINSITNSSNTTQGANCTGLGFPSPTNSIETYDQFVLGGPGTLADFLQQARGQSHASWNNALMANAVNIYIRAGFGQ